MVLSNNSSQERNLALNRKQNSFIYSQNIFLKPYGIDRLYHVSTVVTPRQVRNYAHTLGRPAKTDSLDAEIPARFAQDVRPEPSQLPYPQEQALRVLVVIRRQLVNILAAEKNRLTRAASKTVGENLKQTIDFLDQRISDLDKQIVETVKNSPIRTISERYRTILSTHISARTPN